MDDIETFLDEASRKIAPHIDRIKRRMGVHWRDVADGCWVAICGEGIN